MIQIAVIFLCNHTARKKHENRAPISFFIMPICGIMVLVIELYVYYNPNPRDRWYAGDCVIRAISKAEGQDDWEKIYTGLSAYGFMIGDWANSNAVWDAYLRDNGYRREILPNTCPYCYNIADFARDHSSGTYIVATGKHAVAIVDGTIFDSWDSSGEIPIYYYTKER